MEQLNSLISNYLAGECTDKEKQILKDWIKADLQNEAYFLKFEKLWKASAIDTAQFDPDVQHALEKIENKIKAATRSKVVQLFTPGRGVFYYASRVAAILIIGLCVGLLGYILQYKIDRPQLVELVTQSDKKSELQLADGTKVWINGNSKIKFPNVFEGNTREIFLDGEAYFQVSKDAQKPFIIHLQNSAIQVIGTSFNIRSLSDEDSVVVDVTSGKVAFYADENEEHKIFLLKGDRGSMDKNSQRIVKVVNDDPNFLSWQTEKIIFDNTSFTNVATALSRHYHKTILIDKNLLNCRLTSVFDHQTLAEVLDELRAIHDIQLKNNGDVIRLSGDGC